METVKLCQWDTESMNPLDVLNAILAGPQTVLSEAISRGRQGREAQNIVKVYLEYLRLEEVGTDVLIVAFEPIHINPLSESASTVGVGYPIPVTQVGCMRMAEVFKLQS